MYIYIYVHVKIHAYTSIFEGQPSKTRPFPIKTWGRLGYIYIYSIFFSDIWTLNVIFFDFPRLKAKSQKEDTMVGKWFLMEGPIANEKVEDLFCTGVKAGTLLGWICPHDVVTHSLSECFLKLWEVM